MEPSKPHSPANESKLHFLDYWRIIRIRMTVILSVFLLVAITTTFVTFMLPKSYVSTTRIAVEKDATAIIPLLGIRPDAGYDPYFIQTEFEKIQSSSVLDPVIEKHGLQSKWSQRYGVEGNLKIAEARQILQKKVDVQQYRNTSLIEIKVYDEDREDAAEIANAIAESYSSLRMRKKSRMSEEGIKALEAKRQEQEETVVRLQQEVDALREEHGITDIDTGTGMPTPTIEPEVVRALAQRRLATQEQLVSFTTLLSEWRDMPREKLRNAIPTVQPDPLLTQLLDNLLGAEQKLAIMKRDLGENNPERQKVTDLIDRINLQIDEKIDGILDGLNSKVRQLSAEEQSFEETLQTAKEADLDALKRFRPYNIKRRELETQTKVLENLIFRIIQETVDQQLVSEESIVQVIDRAEPALRAAKPNIPLNIALGIIVGLIMGVGLAFFIEYLDTSVKTIDDVERALQAPVLGVIPQNVGALLDEGPETPHAEAYRVLRTNILFGRKDPTANTLTVVSGGAGEGKSTTIFNLATVFAQAGQRVLLVDSDLRRPSLHKYLRVSNSLGLTNFLLKQNTFEEVVQTTSLEQLHFLPSGKLPSSSMGILNSTQMKGFVEEVKRRYDFVFFDSPPIMGVSDASILASEVDMSLLVVQYRKYPQVMTVRAKQMVEKIGGNLLGVVLNNINISQDSYYYYYSGYYYDYYSKRDDEQPAQKNGQAQKAGSRRGGVEVKQKY